MEYQTSIPSIRSSLAIWKHPTIPLPLRMSYQAMCIAFFDLRHIRLYRIEPFNSPHLRNIIYFQFRQFHIFSRYAYLVHLCKHRSKIVLRLHKTPRHRSILVVLRLVERYVLTICIRENIDLSNLRLNGVNIRWCLRSRRCQFVDDGHGRAGGVLRGKPRVKILRSSKVAKKP